MITILFYLLTALLAFRVYNHYRVSNLTLETRYKLLAIQSDLRYYEIENGGLDQYQFLDDSIEYSISNLSKINLWIIYYSVEIRGTEEDHALFKNLEERIRENPGIQKIHNTYIAESTQYLLKKSKYSYWFFQLLTKFIPQKPRTPVVTPPEKGQVSEKVSQMEPLMEPFLLESNY
jgi:hypothetical protein